ncbi:hypothetical protein XH88_21255 [Bradyrhizobium sp. CCBAU 51627]|nr:hypothetical protein [Bradyrhizobium sp. CCBAU 51627]
MKADAGAIAMDIPRPFRSKLLISGDPARKTGCAHQNGILLPDDFRAAIVAAAREVGASETSIQWATHRSCAIASVARRPGSR